MVNASAVRSVEMKRRLQLRRSSHQRVTSRHNGIRRCSRYLRANWVDENRAEERHRLAQGGGALMERGPLALFGAIVAVGLGPALWLGAQLGNVAVSPHTPTNVILEQKQDAGGDAGLAPEDPTVEVKTTPRSQIRRLSATPSARPSTSTKSAPPPVD